MDFCHLIHSQLAKHRHRYKGRCSRRDDVKDDSGTEQFSQNQELKLFKWQQQHILDASARLCGMAGDQRHGVGIHAGTHVRSFHAVAIARRRAPTSVDKTPCHPVGDRNNGTRLKNQWFVFLERNLDGHPLAGLLSERGLEEVLLRPSRRKEKLGSVFTLTEDHNCSFPQMWTMSRWLEREKFRELCGKFGEKTSIWKKPTFCCIKYIWVAPRQKQKLISLLNKTNVTISPNRSRRGAVTWKDTLKNVSKR